MNFKQWLLEYEDDIDYDMSDPYSAKLPTRRTMIHDIGADVRDDFGKIFAKRMGSAMPSKGSSYNNSRDPIKSFNDQQYLVVMKDEPYNPTGLHPEKHHIRDTMTVALNKVLADPKIDRQLAASRCSTYIDRTKVETKIFQKDGKQFVRFTFRFKMNSTPGHNYHMNDKINNNDKKEDREGQK